MNPQLSPTQGRALATELRTRTRMLESRLDFQQDGLPPVEYARQELQQDAGDWIQRDGDYEVQAAVLDSERQQLAALRSALQRMDDGAYGLCVACGQAIAVERLNAVPETSRCLECESMSERSV